MAADDKFDAKKDQVTGNAKEAFGKVTGDQEAESEGKAEQMQGKGKDAAEKAKETLSDAKDSVKGFAEGLRKKD